MKIEIVENTFFEGNPVKVGDVVDSKNPHLLIGMGKAVAFVEKKPAKSSKKKTD